MWVEIIIWKVFVQRFDFLLPRCSLKAIGQVLLQLIRKLCRNITFMPTIHPLKARTGPELPFYHWCSEDTPLHLQWQQQQDHSFMLMECKCHSFIHFSSSHSVRCDVMWCYGLTLVRVAILRDDSRSIGLLFSGWWCFCLLLLWAVLPSQTTEQLQ